MFILMVFYTGKINAGYGCYIGHVFAGVLAYADDVLLAPSASAMRMMLALCDEFATEFSVVSMLINLNV